MKQAAFDAIGSQFALLKHMNLAVKLALSFGMI